MSENTERLVPTPGQTIGPFYGYALPYEGGAHLVPPGLLGRVPVQVPHEQRAGADQEDATHQHQRPQAGARFLPQPLPAELALRRGPAIGRVDAERRIVRAHQPPERGEEDAQWGQHAEAQDQRHRAQQGAQHEQRQRPGLHQRQRQIFGIVDRAIFGAVMVQAVDI